MSTSKLLTVFVKPGTQSSYMMVDDGQLVGMISLKDLLELISLKLEIDSTKCDRAFCRRQRSRLQVANLDVFGNPQLSTRQSDGKMFLG